MIQARRSKERGHADHGWLSTYHTFSFADYYDPQQMGFRALRVINEDRVRPGAGFGEHGHRDMEIVSYIVSGSLAHKDSMGHGSVLTAGDVQRMTAGTGVLHSEMNPSLDEPVHFLQIWILPERPGLEPGYQERSFPTETKQGRLRLLVSGDPGRSSEETLGIHQDVDIYAGVLAPGETLRHELQPGRHCWVQLVRGEIGLNDLILGSGDGAAVSDEQALRIEAHAETELLLLDLA